MKLLITGATGFIGQYIVVYALKYGCEVTVAVLSQEEVQEFSWAKDVNVVICDLNERSNDWYRVFGAPDSIIHLAWQGLPNYMSMHHIEENYISSYLLLKNLIENGTSNITAIGTCFEYGLKEGQLEETSPCFPVTTYGQAKHFLHQSLSMLQHHYDFSYKWVRIFYPYGQNNPRSLLGQLDHAIEKNEPFSMSLGEQIRDYLPVELVAEYIFKIAMQNEIFGAIHCCSGQPISVRRFVEQYLKIRRVSIELKLGEFPMPSYEPLSFWGSTQRLSHALEAFQKMI